MQAAIITTGGIGDVLHGLIAATLWFDKHSKWCTQAVSPHIYVNSHQEIVDFINKCTYFKAYPCPARVNNFRDAENPLNLPSGFIDNLFNSYNNVYSCFPDALGQAAFSFPWFQYVKSYKGFLQTKIRIKTQENFIHEAINKNTKNIFIHPTSVTFQKNYPLMALQELINKLNSSNYNVIISRTSQWKGTQLPFFLQGKYYDLVDRPIEDVVNVMNNCDYFVGIDSGLSHIAYHLGLPRLVLQYDNNPYHIARYHEDVTDDLPLSSSPEQIFNRIMLNVRDPLTYSLPAYMQIPYNFNTKQLLYKKYYD